MAFSFFGKKDKNPPEAPAPVGKAPPTPPKIQTPPAAASIPAVKPPQPSGLIPTSGKTAGAATTQPMVMPRGGSGLKPTRPGVVQSTRSTQRIVLPGGAVPGKPTSNTKSLQGVATAAGRINLPVGMILRCLPQEVVAGDLADFEAAGTASTEIGLPMNMILSQLPSGKVEMTLGDLVPHFPPGYLQPTASITNYLPTIVSLPLMDVVMRIPPDLLALRPDQKGIDAAVINMADPFTEEILREQAEAARKQQTETNIIDESQVRQAEEFVPQTPSKTIAPPPRPAGSQTGQLPSPAARLPGSVTPSVSARTISSTPSGRILGPPTRATAAIPTRAAQQATNTGTLAPGSIPTPQPTSPIPAAPSVPRQTAAMPSAPIPPTPRHTTSLPKPTIPPQASVSVRPTAPVPAMQPPAPPVPVTQHVAIPAAAAPVAQPPVPPAPVVQHVPVPEPVAEEPEPTQVTPGVPDAAADDLQRLAALAMAQLGDSDEAEQPVAEPTPEPLPLTASQMITAGLPEPEPVAPEPVPEVQAEPVVAALPPVAEAVTVPLPAVVPVPEPLAPEPEPVAVAPEPVEVSPPVAPEPVPVPVAAPAPVPVAAPLPKPLPVAPAPVAAAPVPAPVAPPLPKPLPVAPTPVAAPAPVAAPKPVAAPAPVAKAPVPQVAPEPPAPVAAPVPPQAPPVQPEPEPEAPAAFNLNTCTVEDLLQIPGCFRELAESIVRHRSSIGSFKKIEDLLDVPGMTKAAYTSLTGENPPDNKIALTLNELLGFAPEQHISLKDVADRICCWPDVTGCVLGQGSGLPLVGHTPSGLDKAAIVAFVPKMFETLNKSFAEVTGKETDDLIIPTPGTSFHILRNKDLYLIILSRLPQMPERHLKVARFVLTALGMRRD